jgi:hypothetical protein
MNYYTAKQIIDDILYYKMGEYNIKTVMIIHKYMRLLTDMSHLFVEHEKDIQSSFIECEVNNLKEDDRKKVNLIRLNFKRSGYISLTEFRVMVKLNLIRLIEFRTNIPTEYYIKYMLCLVYIQNLIYEKMTAVRFDISDSNLEEMDLICKNEK